jgi:aryl-alcohol dehydrogenase-like predicted oxidoreductase
VHPAQAAIAWILAQDGVTAAIPGARNVSQSRSNAEAADVVLPDDFDQTVHDIYDRHLRDAIHPRW